jgi:hypothetical protein
MNVNPKTKGRTDIKALARGGKVSAPVAYLEVEAIVAPARKPAVNGAVAIRFGLFVEVTINPWQSRGRFQVDNRQTFPLRRVGE